MLWEIMVVRGSAGILAGLILLKAVFSTYKLVKEDSEPIWNFILIAISFLAISSIFGVIGKFFVVRTLDMIEYIFMMLSGIVFAFILSFASIRYKHLKVKK